MMGLFCFFFVLFVLPSRREEVVPLNYAKRSFKGVDAIVRVENAAENGEKILEVRENNLGHT